MDIDLKKVILKAHALLEGDPICSEDYLKGRVNSERRSRLGKLLGGKYLAGRLQGLDPSSSTTPGAHLNSAA